MFAIYPHAAIHIHDWPWVVNPSDVLKTVIHHEIIITISSGAILDCGLDILPHSKNRDDVFHNT